MKFNLNRQDPASAIDDLNAGLVRLAVLDNFDGFLWEGTLTAGQETKIPNPLRVKRPPTGFLVLYISGSNTLVAGDTPWDEKRVTLKNHGTSTLTARVFFFP